MTPRGTTYRNLRVPIDPYGDVRLADLPVLIDELEAVRGEPLVVELPPDLPRETQRLLATLGVVVRLSEDAPPMRIRRRR